jgi:multidrug resistance protein MdtO
MGAIAQNISGSARTATWLWDFLKEELAPYPGRVSLVVRMVTASTLAVIIGMTFRIPYTAFAALFALVLSRESIEATANAARELVTGVVLGAAYVIFGALFALGDPMLRLLWVGGSLFLAFYALSALSNYAMAARFGYLIVITIPLWDSHDSTELKVETTLWAVGAITIGSVITFFIEFVFASFRRTDDLIEAIMERLLAVEDLLEYYAEGDEVPAATRSQLTRLATVGTSRLRSILQRSDFTSRRQQHMGALVALVGRLVDIAASLMQFSSGIAGADHDRVRGDRQNVAEIRALFSTGATPRGIDPAVDGEAPSGFPLLGELEATLSLIHNLFTSAESPDLYMTSPSSDHQRASTLVRGTLSDPEHIKFALRGCLAAGLCYVTYNALFWPGIATAMTTCYLTALTTIGASHQKQFLRFAGAIVGGFVIGIGAQVFILPGIDSIGGFTVLFAAVAGLSAWIATSSPRLSYLGLQIAAAFCLMNLEEFKFQASLAVARDRVVGILLGLFMMWLAFDWLWSAPAGVEMKKAFVSAIRLLAQLAREPVSSELPIAAERSYALRETINAQFDKVRSLADGVLFEFGPSRHQDLAFRERIREWQPQLRTLFLMRIASLKYRLQLPGFELPEHILISLREYDNRSAALLDDVADWIEGTARPGQILRDSLKEMEQSVPSRAGGQPLAESVSFVTLLHKIDSLTNSVAAQIARDSSSERTVSRDRAPNP